MQDADLKYDPRDYARLLEPLIRGEADVVYGSRFVEAGPKGAPGQRLGNWILTALSNAVTGMRLSDVYVCYKVFAKIARGRWRVREVAISYAPRTRREGKKITWKDALMGIWHIVRYCLAD